MSVYRLKPFVLNATDFAFLSSQTTFRPLFDVNHNAILNWDGIGPIYDGVGTLIWDGTGMSALDAVALYGTSYQTITDLDGIRDPSGNNNNLSGVHWQWGAVDQLFPRMAAANYTGYVTDGSIVSSAYTISAGGGSLAGDGSAITINNIVDASPRTISLLTTTAGVTYETWATHAGELDANGFDVNGVHHVSNEIYYGPTGEAAVADWGLLATVADGGLGQVDTQARLAASAGQNDHFIGGLNPGVSPSNGFFVLFGQFFDHGLDFIGKGEQGKTITITLAANDPLYGMVGPDGHATTAITISRANVYSIDANGPEYQDHTSPYIDQSQTYGSHQQLTDLLRQWIKDPVDGVLKAGMSLLDGTSLATSWTKADGTVTHDTLPMLNELREHIIATGRDALSWEDVLNLRNRDASGHVTTGNSDSALILDMNPRFDADHLLNRDTPFDSNGNGISGLDANGFQIDPNDIDLASFTYAKIEFLDAQLKLVDPGASFGIDWGNGGLLTLHLSNAPSWGTYAGQTLTGASALGLWVNFSNFNIMNPFPAPGEISTSNADVHDAVSAILMASVGSHYIAGDGRVNENFGLTSVHHIFHEEHNYQVQNLIDSLHRTDVSANDPNHGLLHSFQVAITPVIGDTTASGVVVVGVGPAAHYENAAGDYVNKDGTTTWDLDKVFQATKLVVEMEYQHAAVDQYARNVTPNIQEFVGYSPDKNPAVTLEYAQAAFRFGHSTLRETIDTIDPTHGLTGKIMGYALRDAFLTPEQYAAIGPAAILLGMSHQQMNAVDEFVTPALNQGLLGQPLDLAAINIARGRDLGIPTLNDFREALGLARYTNWTDFGNNMAHPESLANFIAAFSFSTEPDLNVARAKGEAILALADGTYAFGPTGLPLSAPAALAAGLALADLLGLPTPGDSQADLNGAIGAAIRFLDNDAAGTIAGSDGFNHIDTWLGGLAEVAQPGGLLGETFDLVFVTQIESLMDGDRFYYLYRLAGQQFAEEVGNGQLKDIVERNTGLEHLNGNIFGYADKYYEFGTNREVFVAGAAPGPNGSNTETLTTSNNHKYGDVFDQNGNAVTTGDEANSFGAVNGIGALNLHPTMGIYTNSGRSSALDGSVVTIGGQDYIRDTRLVDNGADTGANLLNGGQNLDGTPNSGAESNELIVGTDRNDLIYAQGGDDTVYGEGGNDIMYGGYGIDRLYGGDGSDRIYGGDNPDLIDGGAGDDFLYGESSGSDINGADQVIGGSGNDFISGGTGIDKLSGGTGDDHIVGDGDTDPFTHGSDGNDLVEGNSGGDILYGDNGDDVLVGGADQDQMFGGNGDDIIRPGDATGALTIGTDEVLGGDGVTDEGNLPGTRGFDLIDFSDNTVRPGGVTFDIGNQINPAVAVNGTPLQVPSFQIEGVIGSAGNDTLTGNGDVDDGYESWLIGGNGNDTLQGGLGDDIIIGGSIRLDTLIGRYVDSLGNASTYDHNNDNFGHTEAEMLEDARYQGASHRVGWQDHVDNSGLIDLVNAQFGLTGDAAYAKHFTEMLRSDQFRNTVLGNTSATGVADVNGGTDTVVFAGKMAEYSIQPILQGGNTIGFRIVDHGYTDPVDPQLNRVAEGADIILGVTNFRFTDTTVTAQQLMPPAIAVNDVVVTEGNSGTVNAAFTVSLNHAFYLPVTVAYNTADGTATTVGNDYNGASGTITFAPGSTSAVVNVQVRGDTVAEANETFTLNLTAPTNATIADGTGVATIVNDDVANVAPTDIGWNGTAPASDTVFPGVTTGNTNIATLASVDANGGAFTYALAAGTSAGFSVTSGGTVRRSNVGPLADNTTYTLNVTSTDSTALTFAETFKIMTGSAGVNTLVAATAQDTTIYAGNGADTVTGLAGNDTLFGQGGNDILTGGAGNDAINGGGGIDTAVFSGLVTDFAFNTSGSNIIVTDNAGTQGTDTLTGVETVRIGGVDYAVVTGTAGADAALNGAAGANGSQIVFGLAGADTINGGAGNDILVGGAGNDTVNGGANDDLIVVNSGDNGRDVIDGGLGIDTFELVGNAAQERFTIYAAGSLPGGFSFTNAASTILVTRETWNGTAWTGQTAIAELRGIEEIKVLSSTGATHAGALVDTNSYAGISGDTTRVVGNFVGTGLAYNTITIDGSSGGNTVDISQLTSDHRIVFDTGGSGNVIGALRPQDVINGNAAALGDAFSFAASSGVTQTLSDPVMQLTGVDTLVNDSGVNFDNGFGHLMAYEKNFDGWGMHHSSNHAFDTHNWLFN